ncbi:hypothetical protein NGB36_05030 [Streptomyces sp. RB6PN25]|uniref:Uncharacterized protein n=1 Tax=Streptomyces humicola TaxID=2953240 RepID=A0ABT1PTU9_9ACTN|nr:hypothetical protein [Streptomyces humicola]MCQ4079970.1 hypothetical protein [Streptomyces humicola]
MTVLSLWAFVVEQLVEWRYGAAGAVAFGLFTVGRKAGNTTFTCVGLVAIALLLAQ